ncbi:MAG: hypothetical protein A2Y07_06985 [Planctomycetes bacterium GWF2_50_10]|nr:MAG: hypothetical protein A2Y07_06985 [Planctomycetes bacterium GWF2_50_10]
MRMMFFTTIALSICAVMNNGCNCSFQEKPEKIKTYKIASNAHWAVTPSPTPHWWQKRHQAIIDRNKQGNVDLIFIGDSITQGWEGDGKTVWQQYYAKRNAVNMGFGGDQTQQVLWRLNNGELAGIAPKLAIIMIGTNNSGGNDNTANEIGEGIIAICKKIRSDLPKTKILILAIFPRGEKNSFQREKNASASKLASSIADNEWVYYLDIGSKYLNNDGTLSKDLMPDFLHPNSKGYQIEAEAIEPLVCKLMDGDK